MKTALSANRTTTRRDHAREAPACGVSEFMSPRHNHQVRAAVTLAGSSGCTGRLLTSGVSFRRRPLGRGYGLVVIAGTPDAWTVTESICSNL